MEKKKNIGILLKFKNKRFVELAFRVDYRSDFGCCCNFNAFFESTNLRDFSKAFSVLCTNFFFYLADLAAITRFIYFYVHALFSFAFK